MNLLWRAAARTIWLFWLAAFTGSSYVLLAVRSSVPVAAMAANDMMGGEMPVRPSLAEINTESVVGSPSILQFVSLSKMAPKLVQSMLAAMLHVGIPTVPIGYTAFPLCSGALLPTQPTQ